MIRSTKTLPHPAPGPPPARRPLIVVALLLAAVSALIGCGNAAPSTPKRMSIELAGQTFTMDLALTNAQIRRGLMGVESLPDDRGMLFVFPDEQRRSFWMKNCLIPLDAIFLDSDGRIVSIRHMSPPPPDRPDYALQRYSSRWPAQFAIEIRGGLADELGLETGQQLDLPLERLKAMVR